MKFTGRDYAFRRMDGKHNLMIINCLLLVDGALTFKELCHVVESRIINYPRFTQRVVIKSGRAHWESDDYFSIFSHLHLDDESGPLSLCSLSEKISDIVQTDLDPARPLWNLRLFNNVGNGSALLFRIHHCLTDGLGLVHVLNHLTDRTANHAGGPAAEYHPMFAHPVSGPSRGLLRKIPTAIKVAIDIVKIPFLPPDNETKLKNQLCGMKKVVLSNKISVSQLKSIARANQATLNDVWLASVAGALRSYLIEKGENMNRISLRAAVTYSFRRKENAFQLGNEFTLVAVDLPTTSDDPVKRVRRANAEMVKMKQSHRAIATLNFLSILGRCPAWTQRIAMSIFSAKTSVVLTNLEGPKESRFIGGREVTDFLCWVPQTGRLGLGCSLMSYAGRICIGVFSDKNVVENPERLLELVVDSIAELEAS